MKRREILKYTALITGAAVSAPFMGAFLSGCKPEKSPDDSLSTVFDKGDMSSLIDIIDTIIPKTDSPSASDVNVHTTIDHMVSNVYGSDERKEFKRKFDLLKDKLIEKEFFKSNSTERKTIFQELEGMDDGNIKGAITELKQQVVAYYLSTSEVATNYLNYLPVPGVYESCIPLAEVGGKAWAL